MPDINTESMAIAPGVVETIVTLAVRDVAGVASVGAAPSGIRSLLSFRACPSTFLMTTRLTLRFPFVSSRVAL